MKKASIYKKGNRYYVMSDCVTEMGVYIACGECRQTEDRHELYGMLMRAFEESRSDVPHPHDFKEFTRAYLAKFGVKSLSQMHKGMVSVGATEEKGLITLTPYANLGAKEGFRGEPDMAIKLQRGAEAKVVMEAIDKALSLAKEM